MAGLWTLLTLWLCATLAWVLPGFSVRPAWAQTTPAMPGVPSGTPADPVVGLWSAVILGLGTLLLIVAVAKFFDLRRRRESEAVQLQAQLSDALLQDRALFDLSVTPTAHVPMWTGSPAVIELSGDVPSPELREAVLRLVRKEASRMRSDVRIDDHITVLPPIPMTRAA